MARLLFWRRPRDACPVDEPRSPSYKPVFLRLPFLLSFAVYLCLLLAVLEWGCRVFPSASDFQDVPNDLPQGGKVVLFSAPLVRRQAHQTPASTAGPLLSRVTAAPKAPRRLANSHIGLFQKRNSTSETGEAADTADTIERSETILGTDSISERSESSAAVPRSESDKKESTLETTDTSDIPPTSELSTSNDASTTTTPDASTTQPTPITIAPTPTVINGVTVMLRPPVTVAGRVVQPPEFVDVVMLQNGNNTQYSNTSSSSNYTSPLMRRRPDMSKYAHLSGPTVGVAYYMVIDQARLRGEWVKSGGMAIGMMGGARLAYYMPSEAESEEERGFPCDMQEEGYEGHSWGLITCNGPAFVFHDSRCYTKWVSVGLLEERLRREREELGLPFTVEEGLDYQWMPKWEDDLVRPCPGSAVPPENIRQPVEGSWGYQGSPAGDSHEPDTTSRITIRDPDGQPTFTGIVDQYFKVNPANGQVTATSMVLRGAPSATGAVTPVVLFNHHGVPTATVRGQVVVITDSRGMPVATTTRVFPQSTTVVTLRNEKGEPTATETLVLPPPSPTYGTEDVTVTLTNSLGIPSATVTGKAVHPKTFGNPFVSSPTGDKLFVVSYSSYWLVLYMPVVLTLFCAIFSEMVSNNLRELLPFNAMTRTDGATAEESLLMPKGVISGVVNSFQLLFRFKQPVSLLSDLMVVFSAVITTLSTEAVGIQLGGSCQFDDANGCYMGMAVFLPPARAVQALLIASLLCVLATAFILWRWDSGVAAPPGSLMTTGSLMQNGRVLELFRGIRAEGGVSKNISDRSVVGSLQGQRFKLQHYRTPSQRVLSYGIVAKGPRAGSREGLLAEEKSKTWIKKTLTKASTFTKMTKRPSWATTPGMLDWSTYRRRTTDKVLDVGGLLYLAGLMILIIYYNVTIEPNTSFERFINDQDSGVRVLFTAFGVLLSFFWDYYYARVALMEPYRQLWRRPQPALKSVAVAPPTTVFVGIWEALTRREMFAGCVAFANIISKLTPPLLSNVPFSPVQTWLFHQVSTWTAMACLVFLTLVLAYGTLFVKYPHMPIDPGSVAGKMYYLCDSDVIHDFQGLAGMGEKECLARLDPDWKYTFGKMTGVSGEQRIGVQAHVVAPAKEVPGWEGRESSDQEAGGNRPSDDGMGDGHVGKQALGKGDGRGKTD